MKKQILTFLLAILLLLTACQASDPDNLFGTTTPPSSAPDSVPETTVPMEVGVLGEAGNAYAYSTMQGTRDFAYDGTQVLFIMVVPTEFSSGEARLCTYDLSTGEVSFFCRDATCLHKEPSCPSVDILGNLEWYEGKLYATAYNFSAKVLQGDRFEKLHLRHLWNFFHANGDLFVKTADGALLRYPGGDGDAQVVIEEFTGMNEVVFGEYLYFMDMVGDQLCRFHLNQEDAAIEPLLSNVFCKIDGEHIYYSDMSTWHLYRCDMDGKNPELLLDIPVNVNRSGFDDTYFYYLLYTDFLDYPHPSGEKLIEVWRFPKDDPSQKERIAELPCTDGNVEIVPGYERIFVACRAREIEESLGKNYLYTMLPDGSDLRLHPLPVELDCENPYVADNESPLSQLP